MKHCIYKGCSGRPEWEHAMLYAGKQVNEAWAILPVCEYHHRGKGLNKEFNHHIALQRVTDDELSKFAKSREIWIQDRKYLQGKYGVLRKTLQFPNGS